MMRRFLFFAALAFAALSASAQSRELHWESVSVKAHLDENGDLRVDETQAIVFTGDWNGGERTFNIRPRQRVTMRGMDRVDPQSGATPMSQGSLSDVDHYDWAERNVLRWRSRNPSDPPFDNTTITYVLHYTLSNALQRKGDDYVLDHDFVFPDRAGTIERLSLELTFDPAWKPLQPVEPDYAAGPLAPGRSFVLTIPLRYEGAAKPAADDGTISTTVRYLLGSLVLLPLALLGAALFREKSMGRLDPLRPDQISRSWLQQNLLRIRAEVVGAMWDEDVGASEVSAVLARMVSEGKITSRVAGDDMHLTLKVPRQQLEGYERELVDGLFVQGDATSTELVRTHYKDQGFNPVSIIKPGVEQLTEEQLPKGEKARVSGWLPTLLFFATVGALAYAAIKRLDPLIVPGVVFIAGLFASVLAIIGPNYWRKRKGLGVIHALLLLIPAALVVAAAAFVVWRASAVGSPVLSFWTQLGTTLMGLFVFSSSVNSMRSRESRESIAFRKMLTAARDYFRRELEKPTPSLEDAWYPYVLAFGLGNDVDKWFRRFPAAGTMRTDRSPVSSSSASSGSSSSSGSSWTGGGGGFGGAGASGAWSAAAAGMAAGVSAPSSSGSGSSGGGGGGSSGGGGGGGW